MPGYELPRSAVKDTALFDKYQCPYCSHLLKKAVQPPCGHLLCESCANELLSSHSPKCPRSDCLEDLQAEGAKCFPDRFVRFQVEGLVVTCPHGQEGCDWEDSLGKLDDHLRTCKFVHPSECPDCGSSHNRICPKTMIKCPLGDFGCSVSEPMLLADLKEHIYDHGVECLQQFAEVLTLLGGKRTTQAITVNKMDLNDETKATGQNLGGKGASQAVSVNKLGAMRKQRTDEQLTGRHYEEFGAFRTKAEKSELDDVTLEFEGLFQSPMPSTSPHPQKQRSGSEPLFVSGPLPLPRVSSNVKIDDHMQDPLKLLSLKRDDKQLDSENRESLSAVAKQWEEQELLATKSQKLLDMLKGDSESGLIELRQDVGRKGEEIEAQNVERLTAELRRKDEKSNCAELGARPSLIENNGSVIWKIPRFSQRMLDAQTSESTSIFSLPFYTGKHGYKMCLQLYFLGDGIGINSHMSLFLAVMKGKFDSSLNWPFTHKVTFKLINQTGGEDIIDTFQQPDPMNSLIHKPKSDMHIVLSCPCFVSHAELGSGEFYKDDTVFIECLIDSEG